MTAVLSQPTADDVLANTCDISLTRSELLAALHRRGQLVPLLRQTLAEKISLSAARDAGLSVSSEELQRAADRFRQRNGLHQADATNAWLAEQSLTLADLEAVFECDLLIDKFRDHLFALQGTAHFEANRARYCRVRLRRLAVPSEEAAREMLLHVTEEAADLAELARQHDLDPAIRAVDGDLGTLARWQLTPSVAEAVFAAYAGQVVGPLASGLGFLLLRVEEQLAAELDGPTSRRVRQEVFDGWIRARLADVRLDLTGLEGPHGPD